jgi:hypothetical protein
MWCRPAWMKEMISEGAERRCGVNGEEREVESEEMTESWGERKENGKRVETRYNKEMNGINEMMNGRMREGKKQQSNFRGNTHALIPTTHLTFPPPPTPPLLGNGTLHHAKSLVGSHISLSEFGK